MHSIIKQIRRRAADQKKHIVFPEGEDPRVIKAAQYLVDEQICRVTVLRDEPFPSGSFTVLNHRGKSPHIDTFSEALWSKQKRKLESRTEADRLLQNPLYYGASMVAAGLADGCVAGSVAPTADVIRAAIQVIGVSQGSSIISSTFLMAMPDNAVFTYADCGVVPYPSEQQLADIALTSARTHERLTGQEPVVAMLSFSTKGSAPHPRSRLVKDALRIVKEIDSTLTIDGELQFDAAFVPNIAKRKAPNSSVAGKANVFIFPNLDAGNIAYKITERLAGAGATGPILQGLDKPMMDLSRGCRWQDIVNAACVAILMGND